MEKYTLFLDESSDKEKGLVLVSGFAIPNSQLELFNDSMLEIKKLIWDEEYINNNPTVLHCTELSIIYNNRSNPLLYQYTNRQEYRIFKKMNPNEIKEIYKSIYIKMCEIMRKFDITVFGCLIDEQKMRYLFDDNSRRILEDPYNIAIQVIIENYTHFLNKKNGVGYIVYESRNTETEVRRYSLDMRMYDNFCKIKSVSKGLPYINTNSITNRIRYFNIIRKTEENAGIELADFISFHLFKSFSIHNEADKSEFIKKIEKCLYNGGFLESDKNLKDFFGVRHIPEDFEAIHNLEQEVHRLKNAYKKLKREKEKLLEKNKILKQEKEELKEKIKKNTDENTEE